MLLFAGKKFYIFNKVFIKTSYWNYFNVIKGYKYKHILLFAGKNFTFLMKYL